MPPTRCLHLLRSEFQPITWTPGMAGFSADDSALPCASAACVAGEEAGLLLYVISVKTYGLCMT